MTIRAGAIAVILVVSMLGAAAAPAATQQAEGEAYSGTYVQFQTHSNAVADYAVDGSVVIENVTAQAAGETEGGLGIGVGASSSTTINGSMIQTQSRTNARASVTFGSGAEMQSHDNRRGVVRVTASDDDQVVQANVSGDARAEGDQRVVVSRNDGTEGTFIVVGDGNVSTNENGQVTANVEQGSQLVYRQYNDGRTDGEEAQEEMIQDGTAAAEVYVHAAAESGGDAEGEATSVVEYGQDTTVEVTEHSRNRVNATVERAESQGKVVIVTIAETAVENAESLEVYVDGEAAAQADSYGEVRQSAEEGDEPRYLVRGSSSAEAAADVVVGIDHFSERQISMQSGGDATPTATGDDGTTDDGVDESTDPGDAESTDGNGAGFGALAALATLAAALVVARRR